jgi:paraquat-inducible protein B
MVNSDLVKPDTDATDKPAHQWSWLLRILPVLAIAMAGWLVWRVLPDSGPTITLIAPDAEGINANSSLVFHRGVRIGIVKDIVLAEDNSSVDLVVELAKYREDFAKNGARFWIVKPEIGNASLQGLATLVSGPEIHADPGDGEPLFEFMVEPLTPLSGISSDDLELTLQSSHKGAVVRGSRIIYRDMNAGIVTAVNLADDSSRINIEVNIFPDFIHLIRNNTVFWNSGGLEVDFGLFSGAQVRTSSLSSLFGGEISFATPDEPGIRANSGQIFILEPEAKEDWLKWQPGFDENGDAIIREK